MKNNFIIAAALAVSGLTYAQVGINTNSPKATLDVIAKKTDGTTAEGFIAPRLTGNQIKAGDSKYGSDQNGTIIFATSAVTGGTTSKTINITAAGYYYFDSTIPAWIKVGPTAVTGAETKVNAGTNVTVTGSGTTAAPYVINSAVENATATPSTAITASASKVAVPSTDVQGAILDLATAIITNKADGTETKVNAGTNVTVTGSGTTAAPYVINSAVENATATPSTAITASAATVAVPSTNVQGAILDLATAITTNKADGAETKVNAGTNVTVTGSGTTAAPYVINSAVENATATPSTAITASDVTIAVPSTNVQGAIANLATAIKGVDQSNDAWINSGTSTILQNVDGTARSAGAQFVALASGNVGIGTNAPGARLEVNSSVANTSGVRFTNLKSTSPVAATAATLGVNASGDIVTVNNTFTTTNETVELDANLSLNPGQVKHNAIPFTLPSAGSYLISYTVRATTLTPTTNNFIVTASIITQGNAAGSVVGLSEILVARFPPGMGSAAGILGSSGSGTIIINTNGPTTYYVRIENGGNSIGSITSGQTGRSTVTYVKISN